MWRNIMDFHNNNFISFLFISKAAQVYFPILPFSWRIVCSCHTEGIWGVLGLTLTPHAFKRESLCILQYQYLTGSLWAQSLCIDASFLHLFLPSLILNPWATTVQVLINCSTCYTYIFPLKNTKLSRTDSSLRQAHCFVTSGSCMYLSLAGQASGVPSSMEDWQPCRIAPCRSVKSFV